MNIIMLMLVWLNSTTAAA